jgi:hypothetical protein
MNESAPSLVLVAPDVPKNAGRPRYMRSADDYGHLGISRRTFFRWLEVGDALGIYPPFDAPEKLETWWESARAAGQVRNRLPAAVLERLRALSTPAAAAVESAPLPPEETAGKVEEACGRSPPEKGGGGAARAAAFDPRHEIRAAEERVLALRTARDDAYAENRRGDGDKLDRQYWEKLTEYTVVAKRVGDMLEKSGALVARADVEADLAARITGIVVGGMFFYSRIASRLAVAADLAAQNEIWREFWREQVGSLLQGRFVPEFVRSSPPELWGEVVQFIEAKRPPDLRLAA